MHIVGRPCNLSTMHSNCNSDTLAFIKRKAEKGICPSEVIFRHDGLGIDIPMRGIRRDEEVALVRYADMESDNLGLPIFGDLAEIEKWIVEAFRNGIGLVHAHDA